MADLREQRINNFIHFYQKLAEEFDIEKAKINGKVLYVPHLSVGWDIYLKIYEPQDAKVILGETQQAEECPFSIEAKYGVFVGNMLNYYDWTHIYTSGHPDCFGSTIDTYCKKEQAELEAILKND